MSKATLKTWLLETRPAFLLLTPVCVFTGVAASLYDKHPFNVLYFFLAFVGALLAHISVNVLNDYFDFKSGIDLKVVRTPFSGGSGVLPAGLLKPKSVLLLGLGSLGGVIPIGIYFITIYGWAMLPIGLVGVLLISLYTPFITKVPFTSEITAGGFALIVLGTYFTQTGTYSAASVVVTLVAWLLISNLLLLNEFPDVEADKLGGRKNLPIIIGTSKAAKVYCSIAVLTYALIIGGVVAGILPLPALLGLLTLFLGLKAMKGVLKHHDNIDALVPYLGTNVQIVLLTPLLMSIGIVCWAVLFQA